MVEHFDEEQIWQELELQNTTVLTHFEGAVSKAVTDHTLALLEESGEEEDEGGQDDVDDDDVGDDDVDDEEEQEEEGVDKRKTRLKPSASGAERELYDEDSDIDFDVDKLEKQSKQEKKTKTPKSRAESEVDDRFFKLSDMEAFLDDMDKREGKETAGVEIDYFHDLPSDDDGELTFDKPATSKSKKKVSCRN